MNRNAVLAAGLPAFHYGSYHCKGAPVWSYSVEHGFEFNLERAGPLTEQEVEALWGARLLALSRLPQPWPGKKK
jgi:hypothetical protein